jgi:hypothetical protein
MARLEKNDGPTWIRACALPANGFWSAQLHFPARQIFRLMPSREKALEVCGEQLINAEIVDASDVPPGWTPEGDFHGPADEAESAKDAQRSLSAEQLEQGWADLRKERAELEKSVEDFNAYVIKTQDDLRANRDALEEERAKVEAQRTEALAAQAEANRLMAAYNAAQSANRASQEPRTGDQPRGAVEDATGEDQTDPSTVVKPSGSSSGKAGKR